jgi:hypothetical protein
MRADRVADIARSKMGIMLFRHPCVGMPELCSNDTHRYASHRKCRPMRMAENMETDGRRNPSTGARLGKRSLLMRCAPWLAIAAMEYGRIDRPAGYE